MAGIRVVGLADVGIPALLACALTDSATLAFTLVDARAIDKDPKKMTEALRNSQ